ncbi:MAG: manganese efflux pump [Clostridia bacterium]|nr:manganese efflux pump [Clostridia bacterium]
MNISAVFLLQSILLGVGLAMDAFSVSLANGLNEPGMKKGRMSLIAGVFALFQFAMPLIGWTIVHIVVGYFTAVEKLIPCIALILLCFIGGKMLYDSIKSNDAADEKPAVGFLALMMEGVATSIDALSVGFTIFDYSFITALICCVLIAVTTYIICIGGLAIGKRFGVKLARRAGILGGSILIIVGIEIFLNGIL